MSVRDSHLGENKKFGFVSGYGVASLTKRNRAAISQHEQENNKLIGNIVKEFRNKVEMWCTPGSSVPNNGSQEKAIRREVKKTTSEALASPFPNGIETTSTYLPTSTTIDRLASCTSLLLRQLPSLQIDDGACLLPVIFLPPHRPSLHALQAKKICGRRATLVSRCPHQENINKYMEN